MKKKLLCLTACLGVSVAAIGIVGAAASKTIGSHAEEQNYTLTLSNSNRPTSFSEGTAITHPDTGGHSTVTYVNATENLSGLVNLNEDGYITKDEAKGLTSFNATFTGGLDVITWFNDVTEYVTYTLASGVTTNVCGNYFKIVATEATSIVDVTINYSCSNESERHIYNQRKSGTEASTYLGYYGCNSCDHNLIDNTFYVYPTHGSVNSCVSAYYGAYNNSEHQWGFNGADVGSFISFDINSAEEQTVKLYPLVATRSGQIPVNESFAVYVNADRVTVADTVKLPYSGSEWVDYERVNFGEVKLVKGNNVIKIESLSADANKGTNIAAISFENVSETLTGTPIGSKTSTLKIEAEEFDRKYANHMVKRCEAGATGYSGEGYLGGVGDDGSENLGWFVEYVFYSSGNSSVDLNYCFSTPNTSIAKTLLKTTVNDKEAIANSKDSINMSGSSWTQNFEEHQYCPIVVNKGCNIIKFYPQNGATINLDYLSLDYDPNVLTLSQNPTDCGLSYTSYKVEAENPSASNGLSTVGGDGNLWYVSSSGASGGAFIGHVNDAAIASSGYYYLEYNVTASETGCVKVEYGLGIAASSITANLALLTVNGVETPFNNTINGTGGWEVFDSVLYGYVHVNKGTNTFRINFYNGISSNIDYVQVSSVFGTISF